MRRAGLILFSMWLSVFFFFVVAFGILSFYTGYADELPQIPSLEYFLFSVKEGAMIGALVASLLMAIPAFVLILGGLLVAVFKHCGWLAEAKMEDS